MVGTLSSLYCRRVCIHANAPVFVLAYPRGCEQITNVIAKQPGGRRGHSLSSNMLQSKPVKVLSVRFKVHAVIKADETQKDAALLKLFLFACVWVGVRKNQRKNRGRHLQPLSFRRTSAVISLTPRQAPALSCLHTQALRATTSHTLSLFK